jgi:hypothetical protein
MNEEEGYTRSYRRKWRNPVFKNLLDAGIWSYLTDNAAWRETTVRFGGGIVKLERGQIVTSERFLAEGFCVGRQVVRRLLDALDEAGMITRAPVHGGTVLTITNYEEYQGVREGAQSQPSANPAPTHQPTQQPTQQNGENGEEEQELTEEANPANNPAPTQRCTGTNPNKKEGKNLYIPSPPVAPPAGSEIARQMIAAWAEEFEGTGIPIPRELTDKRITAARLRLQQQFGGDLGSFRAYLQQIRGSPFLMGANDRDWRADFDWALSPSNIAKVREGKYRGNTPSTSKPASNRDDIRAGILAGLALGMDASLPDPGGLARDPAESFG